MSTLERRAWYILRVTAATLVLYLILGFATDFSEVSLTAMALYALTAGVPLIGRRERQAGRATIDERDSEINRVATLVGYTVFWIVLVLGAMAPFFILGPNSQITLPAHMLPAFLWFGWMLFFTARALATIVQYRKGTHA